MKEIIIPLIYSDIDEVIHKNIEVKGPTRASIPSPEQQRGPLMLQGDHGPVAYRNIRLREI